MPSLTTPRAETLEKILGKGNVAAYQYFSPLPIMFPTLNPFPNKPWFFKVSI